MRAFILVLVLLPFTLFADNTSYQMLPAKEKLQTLQKRIHPKPYKVLPPLESGLGFWTLLKATGSLVFLSASFDHTSDEMPKGRAKVIHPLGATAAVEWRVAQNKYSGIFQSGGIGLARLSLAGDPSLLGFTPGMGLKILVDGKPSVNLQVMYSLDGQGDNEDFFQNAFSNNIKPPTSLLLKPLAFLFSLVKNPPTYLPLSHFANITDSGEVVDVPNAPYSLHFRPHSDVKGRFPNKTDEDFRNQLRTLDSGEGLYEIWAKENKSSKQEYIGELVLIDQFTASEYQDEKLFFQHQR